jgi:hypothetical protein
MASSTEVGVARARMKSGAGFSFDAFGGRVL